MEMDVKDVNLNGKCMGSSWWRERNWLGVKKTIRSCRLEVADPTLGVEKMVYF